MFDELRDWLRIAFNSVGYDFVQGQWEDGKNNSDTRFLAVHSTGGPAPDVDDRRQRFRVFLVGQRGNRQDVTKIRNDIESIALSALESATVPCGASSIRAITEPVGPGYTTENRVWFTLDLELLF